MLVNVSKEIDQGNLKIDGWSEPIEFTSKETIDPDGNVDHGLYIYARLKHDSPDSDGNTYEPIVAHDARSNSAYMAKALSTGIFQKGNVNARFSDRNERGRKMTYKSVFRKMGPILLGTTTRIDNIRRKIERGKEPTNLDKLASLRAVSIGRFGLSKTLGIDFKAPQRDVYPPNAR